MTEYPTYSDFGLDHWADLCGGHARTAGPQFAKLSGQEGRYERIARIREALGISTVTHRFILDYAGREILIGGRLVDKLMPAIHRIPFVPWLDQLLQNPIEVWQHFFVGNLGEELRRYYMASYRTATKIQHIVAVCGDGENVLFNFFDTRHTYLNRERVGEPLHVGY